MDSREGIGFRMYVSVSFFKKNRLVLFFPMEEKRKCSSLAGGHHFPDRIKGGLVQLHLIAIIVLLQLRPSVCSRDARRAW